MFACSFDVFISEIQMIQNTFKQNTRSNLATWRDFMVSFEKLTPIHVVFCGNKVINNMSRAFELLWKFN